jgi:AAA+ ATPase superfamily predicted ATPase
LSKYGSLDDQFFNFWFKFVYPNKSDLDFDQVRIKEIKLPFSFTEVRKWWHKDKEIDFLAINDQSKEILFAECKWQSLCQKEAEKVLSDLKEKSKYVKWNTEKNKEYYAIFAKKIDGKEALRRRGFLVWDLEEY